VPYGACTHGWGSLDLRSPVVDQQILLLREVHSRCTLDVHLMKLEVMMSTIGQEDKN
jgi:hypothetical protein